LLRVRQLRLWRLMGGDEAKQHDRRRTNSRDPSRGTTFFGTITFPTPSHALTIDRPWPWRCCTADFHLDLLFKMRRTLQLAYKHDLTRISLTRSRYPETLIASHRPFSTYNKDPLKDWIINPHLRNHIRPSLAASITDDPYDQGRDTGWSLIFLGTGAGKATPRRSNAATALRRGANVYLVDAGEGVQMQIMLSKMSGAKIRKIFSKFFWCGLEPLVACFRFSSNHACFCFLLPASFIVTQ
jgi:hypothetical protein